MKTSTLTSVSETLKDFYPLPGARIKQYVVDTRRENAWALETCPRFDIDKHQHEDNGWDYTFGGTHNWLHLGQQSCDTCEALYDKLESTPEVQAWLAEKAARPPIEPDHTKLSDEIAEDVAMREHPLMAMVGRKP